MANAVRCAWTFMYRVAQEAIQADTILSLVQSGFGVPSVTARTTAGFPLASVWKGSTGRNRVRRRSISAPSPIAIHLHYQRSPKQYWTIKTNKTDNDCAIAETGPRVQTALFESLAPTTISAADEDLRVRVPSFIRGAVPGASPDRRARSWQGFDVIFSRKLDEERLLQAGAPVAAHRIADRQSAPLILNYGNEAQREYDLPRICGGQAFFCIGPSEPRSGSDLASVRTRWMRDARLDGGDESYWTGRLGRECLIHANLSTVDFAGARIDLPGAVG